MIDTATIEDVTEFVLDGTHGSPVRVERGVPVLSAQNVGDGTLDYETRRFTSETEYEAFRRRVSIQPGDVLLTIVGTIGRAAVVDDVRRAVFQRSVAILRPKSRRLHSRYLFHTIKSDAFKRQLDSAANRSAQAGVYLGKLKQLALPVPPLDEQRRIAAILDQADDLRRKRRDSLARLNELPSRVLTEVCGSPASNPMDWPICHLGDVCCSVSDGPHVSPDYVEAGVPFLSTRNIRPDGVVWSDLKFISETDAQIQWKKIKPARGDVLYTKGGTTGIARAVDFDLDFAVWVHVAILKLLKGKVEPVWLQEMLNSPYCYHQSQRLTKGIVNRDLGLRRMVDIAFPLPPLDVQRTVSTRVAEIDKVKAHHRAHLAKLDALFASLQYRAFRGGL